MNFNKGLCPSPARRFSPVRYIARHPLSSDKLNVLPKKERERERKRNFDFARLVPPSPSTLSLLSLPFFPPSLSTLESRLD